MIVLQAIDWGSHRLHLRAVDEDVRGPQVLRYEAFARKLGGWNVEVQSGSVDPSDDLVVAGRRAEGTLVKPRLRHGVHATDGGWCYRAEVDHQIDQLEALSAWIVLVLATAGPPDDKTTQLHVALYELCANVLEHGRPLAAEPLLRLRLELRRGEIHGELEDGCERFDPLARPRARLEDLRQRRSRRGYGLAMIRVLLDRCDHEFHEGVGNRLVFRKEVGA